MGEIIKAFWRSKYNAFMLQFSNVEKSNTDTFVKLDTGATSTVLGLNVLFASTVLKTDIALDLVEKVHNSSIKSKPFLTASGDSIDCYPCVVRDIYLGGFHLDKFYFYIYTGANVSVALLGCDLIRFCDMEKKSKNTIRLYNLDFESYETNFLNSLGNCDDIFELNSLIKSCEAYDDARLYAGAFRELFKEQSDTKDK